MLSRISVIYAWDLYCYTGIADSLNSDIGIPRAAKLLFETEFKTNNSYHILEKTNGSTTEVTRVTKNVNYV